MCSCGLCTMIQKNSMLAIDYIGYIDVDYTIQYIACTSANPDQPHIYASVSLETITYQIKGA